MVPASLEWDPLAGRCFHDEPGKSEAAFPGEGARLMGRHQDAVPAPAVPGAGRVLWGRGRGLPSREHPRPTRTIESKLSAADRLGLPERR